MKSYFSALYCFCILLLDLFAEAESNSFEPVFHLSNFTVFNVSEAEEAVTIATVTATAADASRQGNVMYSIRQVISITGEGVLVSTDIISINKTSGEVSALGGLDAEQYISHVVIIVASDQGRNMAQAALRITINVLDVNEPPVFDDVPYAAYITEEIEPPFSIFNVTAVDLDLTPINRQVRYDIVSHREQFRINEQTGLIESYRRLDAEATRTYSLNVSATDSGNPPQVNYTLVIVHLLDINDNAARVEQLTSAIHSLSRGSSSIGPVIRIYDDDIGPPVIRNITVSLIPSSRQAYSECPQQCQDERLRNADLMEAAVDLLALAKFVYENRTVSTSNCSIVAIARNRSDPELDGYGEISRDILPENFVSGEFSISFELTQTSEGYILVVPDQTNSSLPPVSVDREFAIWIRRRDFRFYYLTSSHSGEMVSRIVMPEPFFDPDSPVTRHYTVVVSASPPLVTLYLDCALVGSAELNGTVVSPNPGINVFIGRSQPNPTNGGRLSGQLHGLYYHPVALRQSQITELCSCANEALVLPTLPSGVTATISNSQYSISLYGNPTINHTDAVAVLRGIHYTNQFDSPTLDSGQCVREIIFTVTEDTGISFKSRGTITLVENDNRLPIVDLNGLAHTGTDIVVLYRHFGETVFISPEGAIMRRVEAFSNLTATFSHVVVRLTDASNSGEQLLVQSTSEVISVIALDDNQTLELRGPGVSEEFSIVIQAIHYVNYNTDLRMRQQRTVTFMATDTEGRSNAQLAISTIILLSPYPQLSLSMDTTVTLGLVHYSIGSRGEVLAPNITITAEDSNQTLLSHAVVAIIDPVPTINAIEFIFPAEVSFTFNESALYINGSFSYAKYQNLLSNITFFSRVVPSSAEFRTRNITFQVFNGQLESNVVIIQVILLDSDPPVIDLSTSVITFNYGQDMIFVAPLANITDGDSLQLENMTLELESPHDNDTLKSGNRTGHVLVFNLATPAEYVFILRSVLYINAAPQPSLHVRSIAIQTCDLTNCTNARVNVTFNAPPQLSLSPDTNVTTGSVSFVQDSIIGLRVAPNISVTDSNDDELVQAQVNLTSPDLNLDTLTANLSENIRSEHDLSTGTLNLLGRGTLAQYEAALSSITFLSRDNASLVPRTISIQVFDSQLSSNILNIQVHVIPPNRPPAISGLMAVIFVVGRHEVSIAPSANITDSDSPELQYMTVELEDSLDNDTLRIDSKTSRLLVFDALLSPTNYTFMLRSVHYVNTAPYPLLHVRTIAIQVCDLTNCTTARVNITFNAPPQLSLSPDTNVTMGSLSFVQGSILGLRVAPNISVSDSNDEELVQAQANLTGPDFNLDTLTASLSGNVRPEYDLSTGTLNLLGRDTLSQYAAALSSIAFHTSDNASSVPRTITVQVFDGLLSSNILNIQIHVIPPNRPPAILGLMAVIFVVGRHEVSVAPSANITDSDSPELQYMTVELEDSLDNDTLRINSKTSRLLVFNQVLPPINYTSMLRSVHYVNTAPQPTLLARTITVQVCDLANCTSARVNITFNTPPQLSLSPDTNVTMESLSYVQESTNHGLHLAPNISVTDGNDEELVQAQVNLTSPDFNLDTLIASLSGSVRHEYDSSTGIFNLLGRDTLSQYEDALSSITFHSRDNASSVSRTISIQVFDSQLSSNILYIHVLVIPPSNSPPAILGLMTVIFVIGRPEVAIAPLANIIDSDSLQLRNLTVELENTLDNDTLIIGSNISRLLAFNQVLPPMNYTFLLRSVLYANTATQPSLHFRTVTIRVCDTLSCGSAAVNVSLCAPPRLSLSRSSSLSMASVSLELNFTSTVRLAPNFTITDLDSQDLLSAEMFFTSFVCSLDRLTTLDVQDIDSAYNSATGVLNLSGQSSLTSYQAALRGVVFSTECTSLELRSITIRVSDGKLNSNAVTVQVIPFFHVNIPPVITLMNQITFQYNQTEILVAPSGNISDTDSQQLQIMTVALDGILGNDMLRRGNETGRVLVFNQTGTPVGYAAILRSVLYVNAAPDLSQLLRTITIQVCDFTDCTNNLVSITVNAPPQISLYVSTPTVHFVEGSMSGMPVASNISVTDPNNDELTRAEIFLHSRTPSSDFLQITTPVNITSHYNLSTGNLALTGRNSPNQYQDALSTLAFFSLYNPFFEDADFLSRTIAIKVFDDHLSSNTVSIEVVFTPVNDPPEIVLPNPNLTFQKNDVVFIAQSANITDVDNRLLRNMTVKLVSSTDNGSLSRGNERSRSLVFSEGSPSEYVSILSTILYINMGAKSFPLSLIIKIQVCDFIVCADSTVTIEIQDQTSAPLSAVFITVTAVLFVLLCTVLAILAAIIIRRKKSCSPTTKENEVSPPDPVQNQGAEVQTPSTEVQPPSTEVHAYDYIDINDLYLPMVGNAKNPAIADPSKQGLEYAYVRGERRVIPNPSTGDLTVM